MRSRRAWWGRIGAGSSHGATSRPKTLNRVAIDCSRAEYSSRDCGVLVSEYGGSWRSVARGSSSEVTAQAFAPTTASSLRVVFHQVAPWANLVSLTRLKVQCLPVPEP